VHPVYLANAFKKKTGLTIGEFQIGVKLEMALCSLLNTSLPIHEIAIQSGFYDPPHFVHAFKYAYKISPQKFRVRLKKLTGYNSES
jgi:AraC family transcriptional regulator